MKVLVVWQNSTEEIMATRMIGPLRRWLDGITSAIWQGGPRNPLKMTVEVRSLKELVDEVVLAPEIRSYIEGLERAVFVEGP